MTTNGLHWTNEKRKLGDLTPWPRNPKYIMDAKAGLLLDSYEVFGQVQPIAIGPNNDIYDGHQRKLVLQAAEKYGGDYEVDVRISSRLLTEKEREKLTIYLDKATGQWDFDILANEFEVPELLEWGFDPAELGIDLEPEGGNDTEPQTDKADELRQKWGTELGQLWALGEHRLICGDCTDRAVVDRVMGDVEIDLLLTDVPYDVSQGGRFDSYNSGITKGPDIEHFDKDFDPHPFLDLFFQIMPLSANWFVFVGAFYMGLPVYQFLIEKLMVCSAWVYIKKFAIHNISGTYAKAYELALYAWNKPHYFNPLVGLESYDYGIFSNNEGGRSYLHPTSKPVSLFDRILRQLSNDESIVCDPFLGSGTTLIACHNLNRRCRAIEIDPGYVAVTLQRFHDHTGIEPELIDTGK